MRLCITSAGLALTIHLLSPSLSTANTIVANISPEPSATDSTDQSNIHFISQKVNSLEQLLQPFKGKTVLIDLWASWCGPCRYEFDNSQILHEFYRAKKDRFEILYISVDGVEDEYSWKEAIEHFNLEGYHVLAGEEAFYKDLFRKLGKKGSLYMPTYAIINAKGKMVSNDAPRPSSNRKLIRKIEGVMK